MKTTFIEFLNEGKLNTITLYHGTCLDSAKHMIENGWKPNLISSGSNQGQIKYLYLTSEKDDALWFAEEKGCKSILEISNIPIDYLIFDPEDGDPDIYNNSIRKAIDKLENGYMLPIKFALTKELSKNHFKLL